MKHILTTTLLAALLLLMQGCAQEKNIRIPAMDQAPVPAGEVVAAQPADTVEPAVEEEAPAAAPAEEQPAVARQAQKPAPTQPASPQQPVKQQKPAAQPAEPAAQQPAALPEEEQPAQPAAEPDGEQPTPLVVAAAVPVVLDETQPMTAEPQPVGEEELSMPTFEDPGTRAGYKGGVKGTVVDRNGRAPIEGARLELLQGTEVVEVARSAQDGTFLIESLPNGTYILRITAPEFLENLVPFTVSDGYMKNLFNLSLTGTQRAGEVDDDSFGNLDMDDSGYNDNPTILFGSNDVFNSIAGFNFSAVRFRARGYSSESQDVYLAGVKLNDAITGYSPYSLWSGLNEAMRSKESVNGAEVSEFGFGGYNGLTNIFGTAEQVRKGLRGSIMTNSALYRLRLMASYATGMMDNGWALAANVSARLGGNDWIDGVYYRSFAYYLAADKKFNDQHKLSLVFFGTPGERGAQNASTQEVYDLMGDNMYNSNWGYQNGKVRNTRVRKTHEPVALVKYEFTPSDKFQGSATVLYRFGKNGYTALDWYDAQDPRPDYYRNLPSYYYGTVDGQYVEDLNRNNPDKYMTALNVWRYADQNPTLTHVDWDRLYNINRAQADGRSKYVQEERHTDQRDLNLAFTFKARPTDWLTLFGGLNGRINRTEYYKVIADLLGGEYFIDVDNFAERDFAHAPYKTQNDLDYYMINRAAQVLHKGDKYGYDYYAQVRNVGAWLSGQFVAGNFSATLAGRVGYESFWREGLMRKGLFPGLAPNGSYLVDPITGEQMIPGYEADGSVTTSLGKSKVARFLTYAGKLNLNYVIGGNMRLYANVGYFNDAPKFNQVFLSPRTRNSMVSDLTTTKTFSADVNWQFSGSGINVRATAYWTKIWDQSKVMSAFDDLQNAFSNFAISGINERHMGIELGFKMPTYLVPNLSLQGALSLGEYIYTSTPRMTQTVDNSAEVVMENVSIPYWSKTILSDGTVTQKHYVPTTPQTAASLGLSYNYNYWFIDADVEFFDRAYLDMNPLYRTDTAVAGLDNTITDEEVLYMTTQERFKPAFLLNLSVGKSWFIQRKYQLGFSLNVKNILNNKEVKTGGYEQTRLVDNTASKSRYYRFDSKYFYMAGTNYMLNVYFRF